ncbi:putative reverse transcriptase domain-containing protein [Tanacetum coccineum]
MKKKSIKRLVEKSVAKAIEEYEKARANLDSAGSSGRNPRNAGGAGNVQDCSHKTFMNGKPHFFNGTEGVVRLRRWIEKVEQVFETCKCAEGRDDIEAYNNRFHELALMCPELVPTEKKKIEKYVRGFLERVKGNITSSMPATPHDAINMARELVEQAVQAPVEGKVYARNLTKCNRCNLHHHGPCPPKCRRCQRMGHMEKDCRARLPSAGDDFLQNMTCFSCGKKGHYKNKCSKAGNQQNEGARARAYVVLKNPLGSFDVIIGMDWLSYHWAVIDCYETDVRIPLYERRDSEYKARGGKRILIYEEILYRPQARP